MYWQASKPVEDPDTVDEMAAEVHRRASGSRI